MTLTTFEQVNTFLEDEDKFNALRELSEQEHEELKLCDMPGCNQIYVTNERHKEEFCIGCTY